MSVVITPNWSDNVEVQAPYALIKGSTGFLKVTTGLDLRAKIGGWLKLAIACGSNAAFTGYAKVYRVLNNDGENSMNGSLFFTGVQTTAGTVLINYASNYGAGVNSVAYDTASGTAFAAENTICLWGVTTIPTANGLITPNYGVEWLNLSLGATTPCIFNTATKYAHNDNEFMALGSQWDVWLPGGSTYVVMFDHIADATGAAMACAAYIQTYDSNSGA
jgi:hypothetical protein